MKIDRQMPRELRRHYAIRQPRRATPEPTPNIRRRDYAATMLTFTFSSIYHTYTHYHTHAIIRFATLRAVIADMAVGAHTPPPLLKARHTLRAAITLTPPA